MEEGMEGETKGGSGGGLQRKGGRDGVGGGREVGREGEREGGNEEVRDGIAN